MRAGIPVGTKLAFNLIYDSTPPIPQQVQDLAASAKAAHIEITLSRSDYTYMIENYDNSASPANADKWAMEDYGGQTNSTYPTQFEFLNTGASGQTGSYSDPTADSLIEYLRLRQQSLGGLGRGVFLYGATAGAVAAGKRPNLGLEVEHLGH